MPSGRRCSPTPVCVTLGCTTPGTAASLLLLLKVPARVVMETLGHSSYQLTMNTYSHVAPELNSEAAQLMAGALWDGDEPQPSGSIRWRPP